MVEVRLWMNRPVVDVDGREKQSLPVAARKRKGHGMHRCYARLQLENGKTVVVISGKLVPRVSGKTEPFIKAGKILHGGNEGGFKTSDVYNGQWMRRKEGNIGASGSQTLGFRCREPPLQIRKEVRVAAQINKADILFVRANLHRQSKHHSQVVLRIQRHAVNRS